MTLVNFVLEAILFNKYLVPDWATSRILDLMLSFLLVSRY